MNYKQLLIILALTGVPFFLPKPEASTASKATGSKVGTNAAVPFSQGAETFELKDTTGKTPKFRILGGSAPKRALAVAIATTINSQEDVNPKIPVKDHIDLRIETLRLSPVEGSPDQLSLDLRISGHEVPFEQTVKKADLLSGKEISMKFPTHDRSIAIFSLQSNGHLKFRFDAKKNQLVISDAFAKMNFESPMIGEGSEAIRFSGLGVRQAM